MSRKAGTLVSRELDCTSCTVTRSADLVVWDSHPLSLGATPKQVFIDGIPQLESPHIVEKPESFQVKPKVPEFDKEAKDAVEYEGLPPLQPKKTTSDTVVFTNLKTIFSRAGRNIREIYSATDDTQGMVVVENGMIICQGSGELCMATAQFAKADIIDARGGSIAPGLVTYGSPLGLEEIAAESSTNDGVVYDPLVQKVPSVIGAERAIIRAVDGLQFGGRDALLAYRAGVTTAITAPTHYYFMAGLGTSFSTGARHKLDEGAVVQGTTAVHVSVRHMGIFPSVSTQIAALRRLLLEPMDGDAGAWFKDVSEGKVTLVVDADSADVIATLILLKREVEKKFGSKMKMTISGAVEAHILAKELAAADVGIIQVPARPFPTTWERLRIVPGHPLSAESSIEILLAHNVTVGIGIEEAWSARNTRFDLAWAAINGGENISKEQALALGSTNVEILLGGDVEAESSHEMMVTEGGDLLDPSTKVIAVISPRRRIVDIL